MVRIAIADDHEVIRIFLRKLIEGNPSWMVCGEASNGLEAVELAARHHPDIIVLDLTMKRLNGLEAIVQIHKTLPKIEILIFSMHDSSELVCQAISAGARGFVLKSGPVNHVESALRTLSEHRPYFPPEIAEILLDAATTEPRTDGTLPFGGQLLTLREREILKLLAEGNTNKDIASRLDLSVATVQTHRAGLMRKLKTDSIAKLILYAVRNHIVDP
jgi:DNA-binding NarL/FixJ family response regulator